MFSKAYGAGVFGVEGFPVSVEADVGDGIPEFSMVGDLSSEVKEARDRVKTAIKNSGFRLPSKKVTVNLSPAGIYKEGTTFDAAIAAAVMAASGLVRGTFLGDSAFVGELGLDGSVKPVRGILSIVSAVRLAGCTRCFLPQENVREGCAISGVAIVGIRSIRQMIRIMNCEEKILPAVLEKSDTESGSPCREDFAEVNGRPLMRRAAEISAAGGHSILFIGPPGTGKTMIAKRMRTILPPLTVEEDLEISKIYSICGLIPANKALLGTRPFRSPHHTISSTAMAGGGRIPKPGEFSLASGGVLFLDELHEYKKNTLETLRQPLEEKKITISRLSGSCEYPANFLLAAAMNPCSCGYYPDRNRCTCTEAQVRRHLGKISGPLLDRFDICVESFPVTYEEISRKWRNESSAVIRSRVMEARRVQNRRFGSPVRLNCDMGRRELEQFCSLGDREEKYLQTAFHSFGWNARAYEKVLKTARTIADLEGEQKIGCSHLAEAAGYRSLENKYWGVSSDGKEQTDR